MATQNIKTPRIYKDVDMLFTKNVLSGDINKKLDANAVKQSLMTLLMTKPYERPFHPELGSTLFAQLFEPMRPGMEMSIARSVEQQILNFEPRVSLAHVDCNPDYDNNGYEVTIRFSIQGINEPQDLTVNLTRLR
jgi:phage baseplate assembly protein W